MPDEQTEFVSALQRMRDVLDTAHAETRARLADGASEASPNWKNI
jgi:hypothetical protein